MAILEIIEVPHPILRRVATPVSVVDARIRQLLDDMAETMYAAPGIGLAAPQVGISERVVVVAVPVRGELAEEEEGDEDAGSRAFLTELINPVIIEQDGECEFEEGCLSVPELLVSVDRAERIVMEALDRHGQPFRFEARGFYAVVFQHELDHLDGVTIYDRLSPLKRSLYRKKQRKSRGSGSEQDAASSAG